MPLITTAQALPLDHALSERLARLQPASAQAAPSVMATRYVGWFNTKPIAAAWVSGEPHARALTGFAIHPATMGRGVLAQLAEQICGLEAQAGHCVVRREDHTTLDPD